MRTCVLTVALAALTACESDRPRQVRPSSIVDRDRERAERERRAKAEADRREREEAAQRERANGEAEWPEPWPAIFLKGEPAPVKTTTKPAPYAEGPSQPVRPRPFVPAPPDPPRPDPIPRGVRSDADAFVRRLELLEKGAMSADRSFRSEAEHATRGWTAQQVWLVTNHPDEARLRGVHEPNEREVQAYYDERLMELRARWIRDDRTRREVEERMKGLKR